MKECKDVRKLKRSYEKEKYLSIQNAQTRFKEILDQAENGEEKGVSSQERDGDQEEIESP